MAALTRLFRQHAAALVYAFFCALIIAWAFYRAYGTDLFLHLWQLRAYLDAGSFPTPPLYYGAVHLLDRILPKGPELAVVLVLGAAAFAKFSLLRTPLLTASEGRGLVATTATWCLLLAAPVMIASVNDNWYLGTLSTAILTNSTTLFVLPVVLWLHALSLDFLQKGERRTLAWMVLAAAVVTMSKPNYLFAQLPVLLAIGYLERRRTGPRMAGLLAYAAAVGIMIIALYTMVYLSGTLDALWYEGERTRIVIAPMRVWLLWTHVPWLKALLSLVFVGLFFVRDPGAWRRSLPLRYATLLFVAALLIFVLLAETGRRETHGNFYWQVPMALLILHFTLVHDLALQGWPPMRGSFRGMGAKDKLLLAGAALHVLAGIAYLCRFILTGHYN